MKQSRKVSINKDKIAYRVIDSQAIILNLGDGDYYDLNATGTIIWEGLNKGDSIEVIFDSLKKEFPTVDDKYLKDDIAALIRDLTKEKLIEIK